MGTALENSGLHVHMCIRNNKENAVFSPCIPLIAQLGNMVFLLALYPCND